LFEFSLADPPSSAELLWSVEILCKTFRTEWIVAAIAVKLVDLAASN